MTAVSQWAEGLPQPLASQLIVLASSWENTYNIYLLHNKDHNLGQPLTKPEIKKWLSYYHNHRLLTDECIAYFTPAMPKDLTHSFSDSLYGKEKSLPNDNQKEALFKHLINEDASKVLLDEETHIFPLAVMFAMFVWLPCQAIYGEHPPGMLRRARHGDLDTMRDLIRIDRSVIFDSGIARHIHEWALDFKNVKLKRVGEAFGNGLPEISKKRIKLIYAQFVYDAAHNAGEPLTTQKIRDLFNAINQDLTGALEDPDLTTMSNDTFYRSLVRNKKPFTKQAHSRDE